MSSCFVFNRTMRRIEAPDISFNDNGSPFSNVFGDIYFAPDAGLAETQTVFLESNRLPQAWQVRGPQVLETFTIAETGFGTGLNFLAVYDLFKRNPGTCRHLHFISVEKYPLSCDQLRQALQPWHAVFPQAVDRLIKTYPLRIPGFHRIWFDDTVTLTLIFDDAITGFSQLDASVDAWFLDGFAPGKNPGMWQEDLYREIARLSHEGTTLASFTAAGEVRRGLECVGFTIERQKGFGHKRHRITGHFQGSVHAAPVRPKHVAIVGAGLAGSTLAHALTRQNISCSIFDRNSGPGLNASSNRLGLVNPKIDLGHSDIGDLGQAMYSFALQRLRDLPNIDLNTCGIFHAATDQTKQNRQTKIVNQLGWLSDHVWAVSAQETKDITGVDLSYDGLFFPNGVTVNTGKLTQHLLTDCDVRWSQDISNLATLNDFDHVIIASSEAAQNFYPALQTVLQPMRGQVTYVDAPIPGLKCVITAGHYVAPVDGTTWVTGATFQRQRTDIEPQTADDASNLAALANLIPDLPPRPAVTDRWAQIRYTTPDRRPILGHIAPKVYIATGLSSHGLQYSFLLAEIVAARLCGAPMPVGQDVLKILDLHRYPLGYS